MLRHEFQDSCLADAVELYQKQEQIQPIKKRFPAYSAAMVCY